MPVFGFDHFCDILKNICADAGAEVDLSHQNPKTIFIRPWPSPHASSCAI